MYQQFHSFLSYVVSIVQVVQGNRYDICLLPYEPERMSCCMTEQSVVYVLLWDHIEVPGELHHWYSDKEEECP